MGRISASAWRSEVGIVKKCKCKYNIKHRECSHDHPNLEMLVFEERGKRKYREKNLSEQSRETTRNSTHV